MISSFPQPIGSAACSTFTLRVDGRPVHVQTTAIASFALFELDAPVTVEVTAPGAIPSFELRPRSLSLSGHAEKNTAAFVLSRPVNLWVDIPGFPPLYLFAFAPETDRPDPNDPKVHYFRAGEIYDAGVITLQSGETLYIEGGATVRGAVHASGARDVTIRGRGVLDGSLYRGSAHARMILLDGCRDARIEDLTLIQPTTWMAVLGDCEDVYVRNLHEIGQVVSSDGIDVVGSRRVTIEGCFLRNNDDCVVMKSLPLDRGLPAAGRDTRCDVEDVLIKDCTFWNDAAGNAMEVGFECCTAHMRNIIFRNIDVLAAHGQGAVFSIHNGDRATISDVLFEDIRIEHFYELLVDLRIFRSRYSQDEERGQIRHVTFRDVQAIPDLYNTPSHIGGYDEAHTVSGVHFENFRLGDQHVLDADALHLFTNRHAHDITFR